MSSSTMVKSTIHSVNQHHNTNKSALHRLHTLERRCGEHHGGPIRYRNIIFYSYPDPFQRSSMAGCPSGKARRSLIYRPGSSVNTIPASKHTGCTPGRQAPATITPSTLPRSRPSSNNPSTNTRTRSHAPPQLSAPETAD